MSLPALDIEPRVSIVVPAYNEEGNVEELCRQFDDMRRKASFTFEVVVVNDGSTDSTGAILDSLRRKYRFLQVLHHSRNRGLTTALQTGFSAAVGEIYIFYPADLQYKPEDIPAMVAKIDEGNDMVTGWKQGKYNKRFVSHVYNGLSRRLFGLRVHDLNSVKAFRKEILDNLFLRRDWHRYLVALAQEEGYRIDEVKLPVYERFSGSSKFSGFWRIPIGILDMIAVKSQLTFLKKPMLYFGLTGGAFFGLGILVGLFAIYLRYFHNDGYRPLLYLVILLVVLGTSLFILGFLAEGLAAIKEELIGVRNAVKKLEDEEEKAHSEIDR